MACCLDAVGNCVKGCTHKLANLNRIHVVAKPENQLQITDGCVREETAQLSNGCIATLPKHSLSSLDRDMTPKSPLQFSLVITTRERPQIWTQLQNSRREFKFTRGWR